MGISLPKVSLLEALNGPGPGRKPSVVTLSTVVLVCNTFINI